MVNKDFCLSSYMAFRYIWKDGVDFAEGFQHKNFRPVEEKDRIPVRTSEDIDREIQKQFDELYKKYDNIGILLSGGMDSANLAAYLKPGSHAYTFNSTVASVPSVYILSSGPAGPKGKYVCSVLGISLQTVKKKFFLEH